MADLSNYILPADSPVLQIVGAVFTVCLTLYLTVLMMRRIYHQRRRQTERLARSIVLRELCKLFDVMLVRLRDSHRAQENLIHSESSMAEATPTEPRPRTPPPRIVLQTPLSGFKVLGVRAVGDASLGVAEETDESSPAISLTQSMNHDASSWEPRASLVDVSLFDETSTPTNRARGGNGGRRPPPPPLRGIGGGRPSWQSLLRNDVRNFIDMECTPLLTEQEREEVTVRSLERLRQRSWLLRRDTAMRMVQRAIEFHYHACCHRLFEEYLQFTVILHRIRRHALR